MVFHKNISEFSALEFTVSETELPATRLIIKTLILSSMSSGVLRRDTHMRYGLTPVKPKLFV